MGSFCNDRLIAGRLLIHRNIQRESQIVARVLCGFEVILPKVWAATGPLESTNEYVLNLH